MSGFISFRFQNTDHAVSMLLFLLLAVAADASCPAHCNCSREEMKDKTQCSSGGLKFTMFSEVNQKAEIYCKEGQLTCANFPAIPITRDGFLFSLLLDSCTLPPSLACLMEKLGARAVETLRVENCSELTGEHIEGVVGLSDLWIRDTNSQKTLPLDAIARSPSLTKLRVHNTPFQFSPSSAQNVQLQRLEILNSTKNITKGVFKGFRNLTKLLLIRNDIEDVNGAFEGLDNLEYLDLTGNILTELRARAFEGAPRLRELRLYDTGLGAVRRGAFEGLDLLEKIELNHGHKQLMLEDLALSHLPSLKTILIITTPLSPLPEDLFKGSKAIEQLTITSCGVEDLPELIFKDQVQMQILKLNENKIKKPPPKLLWTLVNLYELDLTGNFIEVLPGEIFEGLADLNAIHIDSNRLTTIPDSTFNSQKKLKTLTLRDNLLTLLEEDEVKEENYSPFSDLIHLEEIDLSENHISVIFDDWRLSWVHSIKRIDLTRNRIGSLRAQDLEFLGFNVTIDLQYNDITTVTVSPTLRYEKEFEGSTFILDHNPINCDCDIHGFLYHTKKYNFPKFLMDDTKCATPLKLADQKMQDVPLDYLTCDLKDCPQNCTCVKRPETSTMELDCFKSPLTGYPNPESHNLTKSKLRLHTFESPLDLPEHVASLDLKNLSLTEIPSIPDTVLELDLRYNHLSVIPEEIFKENLTLYLVGNHIECDCWNKDQIDLLNRSKEFIKDYVDIFCGDDSHEYLHEINSGHVCDLWLATVVGCSLAAIGVIAAIAAGIAYYNTNKIKKFIYKQGWPLPPGVYEDEIDNKTFDVLISYSDKYEKFTVSHLVPHLKKEGYSVCLRCKEWDIGDFLPHKVPDLVEKSRRTIVLLCSDYFDSEARLELRAALMNERRDKRNRIVVIVAQDLEASQSVNRFLQTRKNISLNDACFWERLKRQLPRKRKEKVKPSQRTKNVLMAIDQNMLFNSKMSLNQL